MYLIRTEIHDKHAETGTFQRQKTMYGSKQISKGDTLFIFASENEGGVELIAKGTFSPGSYSRNRA